MGMSYVRDACDVLVFSLGVGGLSPVFAFSFSGSFAFVVPSAMIVCYFTGSRESSFSYAV